MERHRISNNYAVSLNPHLSSYDLTEVRIFKKHIRHGIGPETHQLFVEENDTGWMIIEEGVETTPSFILPTHVLEMITEMMNDKPEPQTNDSDRLDKFLTAVLDGTLRYRE